MIRCVRLWTGEDSNSHFEEGAIDLAPGARGDFLSDKSGAASISFQETESGGSFAWHNAPVRQVVITLSGTLDFHRPVRGSTSRFARATFCWPRTPPAPGIAGG